MSLPDNQTLYCNFIDDLSENQFKEFVQLLNKCKYKTKEVVITDGCYDGGNDLRVIKDGKSIRKNIQVTVQSTSIDQKVLSDVAKSADNVLNYAYQAQLDFYVNKRIPLDRQNTLEAKAESEYGISLHIYDGPYLANMVSEYPELQSWLRDVQLSAFPDEKGSPLNLDNKTKVVYDSISMGAGAQEMKGSLISAYFLSYLYEKKRATVSEVSDYLDEVFCEKINRSYYEGLAGQLKQQSAIEVVPGTRPKEYVLSQGTRNHLDLVIASSALEERKIISECDSLLSKYSVSLDINDLANYVTDLFDENYRVDVNELTSQTNSGEPQLKKISNRLIRYVEEKTPQLEPDRREILVKDILEVFTSNDVFNRNSVSKMFLTLFQDDKLDDYLSRQCRSIVWDTQVLLRFMSVLLFGKLPTSDSSYSIVEDLVSAIKDSAVPIKSFATYGYIKETAIHIREAIRLERFLSLPGFRSLGKSKNVIYNYYDGAQKSTELDSLSSYLSEKLKVDVSLPDNELDDAIFDSIHDILDISQIKPVSTNDIQDNEVYQRQYDIALSEGIGSRKSQSARHHDLKTILYLSHLADDQGQTAYIITWDKSFYRVRESFSRFREINEWFIYTPQKFVNTLSVINFKIDVSSLNNGIISIMNDINSGNEQPSVIDLLNSLFSGKQLNGIDFINSFRQMRQSLLINEEDNEENATVPIDEMLEKIITHYKANEDSLTKFVDLLESSEYASLIINVFKDSISSYSVSSNETIKTMIGRIDDILEEFEYE